MENLAFAVHVLLEIQDCSVRPYELRLTSDYCIMHSTLVGLLASSYCCGVWYKTISIQLLSFYFVPTNKQQAHSNLKIQVEEIGGVAGGVSIVSDYTFLL